MRYLVPLFLLLSTFATAAGPVDLGPLFPTLKNSDSSGGAPDTCTIGTAASGKNGPEVFDTKDSSGNLITPTASSYGSQIPRDSSEVRVGASTATETSVTLTTANTAQTLVAANPQRKWIYIINASGATVSIGLGYVPTTTTGISIANNTTFTIDFTNLWLGSISAVAGSNNRTVQVVEGE